MEKLVPKLRFKSEDGNEYPCFMQVKLGDVCTFFNGKAHENLIVNKGRFIVVNSKFISSEGTKCKYTNFKLKPLEKNTIVIVMSDIPRGKALGKTFIINDENLYTLNQRIGGLKVKNNDPNFINQILNRNKYYLKFDDKVGQTNLRKSQILNCPLKLPCIEEQRKIAEFFLNIEKIIDVQKKKITKIRKYKKILMRKIFNHKLRFKKENGLEYSKWEEKRLQDCLVIGKAGGTPRSTNHKYYGGNIKFLSISDMSQGKYIKYTEKRITEEGLENSNAWIVPVNSILFSIYASIGYVSINHVELATSQAIFSMIVNDENNIEFIYYFLEYYRHNKITKFVAKGAQGNLNSKIVRNIILNKPCIEEQNKISNFFSNIDRIIEKERVKLKKIEKLKKGLIKQMVFT